MSTNETSPDPVSLTGSSLRAPALVLLWTPSKPSCRVIPYPTGTRTLKVGRSSSSPTTTASIAAASTTATDLNFPQDPRLSRDHALLSIEGDDLIIKDTSRNGTFVDGKRVQGSTRVPITKRHVLRFGQTIFLVEPDTARLDDLDDLRVDEPGIGRAVAGAAVRRAWREAMAACHDGEPIFVHAETGPGKQHIAALVHHHAGRKGELVQVNCSRIDRSRADADLFGVTKGAYTNAEPRPGHFEAADGGTLFLDEFGELDLEVQGKLLLVMEQGLVQRLGSHVMKKVDVQLVLATHRDLAALVREGRFRRDLYERITHLVELPPLRDRPEEIPHLIALLGPHTHLKAPPDAELIERCLLEPWGGNIRALRRVLVAAKSKAKVDAETGYDLKEPEFTKAVRDPFRLAPSAAADGGSIPAPSFAPGSLEAELADEEAHEEPEKDFSLDKATRANTLAALEHHNWVRARAARALNISRTSLYRLIEEYGLEEP